MATGPMDVDLVSDLNGDGPNNADTVSANVDNVQVGRDPPVQPPQKVGKTDTQEQPAEKPKSLRDQISSALKGEEVTPPVAQQDGGRERNPDGTFKAKAPEVQQPEQPVQQAAPPMAAPPGVDPVQFQALPKETQEYLARTLDAVNARHNQYRGYDAIEQIIGPRRQAWALNGMTEVQAVNQLFALSDFASRDPQGFIKYFAQQTGVDLETIGFDPDPVDPQVLQLQQQVGYLTNQLQGFTAQQQQYVHQNTVDEITQFFGEKDAGGNALRPYAEELGDQILPYIQVVLAQNPQWSHAQVLQEAYDRAIWSTPGVRAKLQQTADTAAQAEQLRQQQERARKAQAAGASIAPGVPDNPPPSPANGSMSLRDTIKASIANAAQ